MDDGRTRLDATVIQVGRPGQEAPLYPKLLN